MLYKKKFAIVFYSNDEVETLQYLFDSVQDMANFLNKSLRQAYHLLNAKFASNAKNTSKIIVDNSFYRINLIKIQSPK